MKKLPPQAREVFSGEIFKVYQWDQKMYDGTMEVFECLARDHTAQVIATTGNKIAVLHEEQPTKPSFIALPGGRIEAVETPLEGAQRELLEETGYASRDWELWLEEDPASKIIWTVYTFIARSIFLEASPSLDPGERIELTWLSFDEFLLLSDEPRFFDPHLKLELFRARHDAAARARLHHLFFGVAE